LIVRTTSNPLLAEEVERVVHIHHLARKSVQSVDHDYVDKVIADGEEKFLPALALRRLPAAHSAQDLDAAPMAPRVRSFVNAKQGASG
jgi:hypothetical protein